jgi:hypothetical protein
MITEAFRILGTVALLALVFIGSCYALGALVRLFASIVRTFFPPKS